MSDSSSVADSFVFSDFAILVSTDSDNESENSNQTWENVNITNSFKDTYHQQCYDLLKNGNLRVTSILGDICINIGCTKFTLDRAVLASKSNYLFENLLRHDEKSVVERINNLMGNDAVRFSNIVDIIYGKDLKSVIDEANFFQLFDDMNKMGMEMDLKIFDDFIDKTIKPKVELNDRMFGFYDILCNSDRKFDYLLPSFNSYFSDRLLKIYRRTEFLSMSVERLIQILVIGKVRNSMEKSVISRICAEWICNDFRNRISHLKDLVNVAKCRYEVLPYYDGEWNPDVMKTTKVQEVEKYFNELFLYHGKVKFGSLSTLEEGPCRITSGSQVVYFFNTVTIWNEILEKNLFCDVAINVQGTIFKLHRVKLYLASEYFRNSFTNQNIEDEFNSIESTMEQYAFDQMDPGTFRSVIRYIYAQEIKVTSETHLIKLIKCSKVLEMDDLFEKCQSIMLQIANNDSTDNIFEIFRCVYENARYSELYDVLAKKILDVWPRLDKNPHYKNISLDILKEIFALPELSLKNPDEIIDLCSKWILHDVETRYYSTIEVARAINRTYLTNNDKLKLEMPSNSMDYTLEFVKEQLNRVLSSTALVSIDKNSIENEKKKPKFLLLNEDEFLSVVDENFNEIIQLARIGAKECRYSATTIDDELFILFNIDEKFYFQSYSLVTSCIISLATDVKMNWNRKYVILCCNNDVYYCDEVYVLKYIPKLNRWVTFMSNEATSKSFAEYTSDGKKIYKIFRFDYNNSCTRVSNKASFYDFEQNKWISMPDIPAVNYYCIEFPNRVNIINHELSVLFSSETCTFSWITQTWTRIHNSKTNFIEFTVREKDIVYICNENEVHVYSPDLKKWEFERKWPNSRIIAAIHTIEK